MCTTIAATVTVAGSGKGPQGWFPLGEAYVAYDHPFHAPLEHAVSLDFVNAERGPGARVAVELTRESARDLAHRILATLEQAEAYEQA